MGGPKTFFLRIRECTPKNKGLHRKICENFHELWGENQKQTKKKISIAISAKKQFLLMNSGLMTSILGCQVSNCTPVAASLILILGHNPRLGGTILVWRVTNSDLGGTAPECPPWRRACVHIVNRHALLPLTSQARQLMFLMMKQFRYSTVH